VQLAWEEHLPWWRKLVATFLLVVHVVWAVLGVCIPSLSSADCDLRLRRVLHVLAGSHWALSMLVLVAAAYLLATYLLPLRSQYVAPFLARRRHLPVVTSASSPQHIDWLPANRLPGGELGLTTAPGKRLAPAARDLEADLAAIRDCAGSSRGCDVVVTLLQASEMRLLGVPTLCERVAALGMASMHMPIHDKWVPDSMREFARVVDGLARLLSESKRIVVHCCGGKGRSGLVVAGVLLWLGAVDSVSEAVDVTRRARRGALKNPIHVLWLHRFVALHGHRFATKVFASL
jgi:protein-tyrosine phosphatase